MRRGTLEAAFGEAEGDAVPDERVDAMDYEELLELSDRIGAASTPASAAAARGRALLGAATPIVLDASAVASRAATGGDAARCVVCLEAYVAGDALLRLRDCPHAFHAPCLSLWLQAKPACPICKRL